MSTSTAILQQGPAFRAARRTARHGNSLNRLVTLLMVAAVTVVFTAKAFPQEVEDEIISEYGAGTLTFQAAGGKPVPALLQATSVTARVSGLLNRVTVKQSFANDSADFVEGVYLFPLPDDAAVDTLEMRIGNRVIVGEIQEKQQARRTYERARAAGQRTSLVQQRRPNLFSTRVANVAPGEVVDIEVGYLQTLHYDQGEFRLRLPMTVTPRYEPPVLASSAPPEASTGDATWQRCEQQSARCHYTDLYLEIDPGFDLARLESLYHAMDVQRAGRTWRLQPADGPILMDRDFELVWQAALGATPEAAIFTEQWQGETFAMIMLLPPEQYAQPATQPRELVFVIDTSGSMDG
ncbi:MAG: hypothetical protein HKN49_08975, partial [Gammaproteobacteria bacterium]|nr:hypothetical protein [Gammaproteobacteria bacterium]